MHSTTLCGEVSICCYLARRTLRYRRFPPIVPDGRGPSHAVEPAPVVESGGVGRPAWLELFEPALAYSWRLTVWEDVVGVEAGSGELMAVDADEVVGPLVAVEPPGRGVVVAEPVADLHRRGGP